MTASAIVQKINNHGENRAMVKKALTPLQRRALEEARLKKANEGKFLEEPDDMVYYPNVGMKLSRFGRCKGVIRRDTIADHADVDGNLGIVNRVRDNLDKMRCSGQITADQYEAAREFQRAFRACGYDRVKTTNLTGASGGGSSIEDHIVRTTSARNQVQAVTDMLGGEGSPMWKAVVWVVGHGVSLHALSKTESGDRKVWTGFVNAAFYLMGQDYAKRLKAKGNKKHQRKC